MIIDESVYLAHYGILRKSGRYPWGSGDNQNTRNKMFLDYVADLKREGLTDAEIARGLGESSGDEWSSTRLRALRTIARNEQKAAQINEAQRLKNKGYSNVAIGAKMSLNESSVRALLAPGEKDKVDVLSATVNRLRDEVGDKKYVDVGSGVEAHMGISANKLAAAVAVLREEGYVTQEVKVLQLGTGLETNVKVLAPPGTTQKEVWLNRDNIRQVISFSDDGGRSFFGVQPPLSISPDRVAIKYKEEGGAKADGVIYVRPGVEDVGLGKAKYAQVRILVGDGHYIKGMAMYKENLPEGVDLLFNTNKSDTGNKLDAMKPITSDPDNPFGAVIRPQQTRLNADGTRSVISSMNIVNEEGDWTNWSRNIASQVLSKQSPTLARTQLAMTFENRKKELENIASLTNPTVRKKLLQEFADAADSASVHLKAAALPRQGWHTILPIDSLSPTQIYAPNYQDGEQLALIRYPHGGTFEIPILTVNNNHPESKRLLGQARDAVGIHHSVAERLSGADFDGDTVLVIPNNSGKIISTPALAGLKDFDPRSEYAGYEGMPKMTARQKGQEMGKITNLVTDMTIQKASTGELTRAVRHSMVVIDAEKHGLNYKLSAERNGIAQLYAKYQGKPTGGAATLLSRATAETRVPDRKPRRQTQGGPIDPVTGRKVYEPTNKQNYLTGKPKMVKTAKLAEAEDANTLLSKGGIGTPMERLYAAHSNRLKNMANEARLLLINTPDLKYSPQANKVYKSEVKSLTAKLALAVRNRPLERQAQLFANGVIKIKRQADPNMDDATLKKIKFQALEAARIRTGAKKARIQITQEEWNAIQAGAISHSRLSQILDNADMDVVRSLATPKETVLMTSTKTRRAKQMLASGYTRAEVAATLGVSLSTLDLATVETKEEE